MSGGSKAFRSVEALSRTVPERPAHAGMTHDQRLHSMSAT